LQDFNVNEDQNEETAGSTYNVKPYAEAQTGEACAKHSINNLLQEEKLIADKYKSALVKTGEQSRHDKNTILNTNIQINLHHYCKILEKMVKDKYFFDNKPKEGEAEKDPFIMCDGNSEKMEFVGIDMLLRMLGYKTHYISNEYQENGYNDNIFKDIGIQLQRRKCLGVILNLGMKHYTCITKSYGTPNSYTYIESLGINGPVIINDTQINSFMQKLDEDFKQTNEQKEKKTVVSSVTCVYDFKGAYASQAARILRENLLEPQPVEITDEHVKIMLKQLGPYKNILEYLNEDTSDLQVPQDPLNLQDALNFQHALNLLKYIKLSLNNMYFTDDVVSAFIKEYEIKDIDDFIFWLNFRNETFSIDNQDFSNAELLIAPSPPEFQDSNSEQFTSEKLAPHSEQFASDDVPDKASVDSIHVDFAADKSPEPQDGNKLTRTEKAYLIKLYKIPKNLAYDLRNFQGIKGMSPDSISIDGFPLKNADDKKNPNHSSYLFYKENQTMTDLYRKIYTNVGRKIDDYRDFYTKFIELKDIITKQWEMIFDWIDKPSEQKAEKYSSNEIGEKDVEEEILGYIGRTSAGKPYIKTIFTLLPKILRGDDLWHHENGSSTGRVIRKDVLNKIRSTFKQAIDSLKEMRGGKKTHKLKIKKRKTHKKRLFRHKTRNAINRL
jgi:hypothetical protein